MGKTREADSRQNTLQFPLECRLKTPSLYTLKLCNPSIVPPRHILALVCFKSWCVQTETASAFPPLQFSCFETAPWSWVTIGSTVKITWSHIGDKSSHNRAPKFLTVVRDHPPSCSYPQLPARACQGRPCFHCAWHRTWHPKTRDVAVRHPYHDDVVGKWCHQVAQSCVLL